MNMKHTATRPVFRSHIASASILVILTTMGPKLWSQQPQVLRTNDGYLFVDGEYVPPPYDIRLADDLITINDQDFAEDYFDVSQLESEFAAGPGRMGRRGMRAGPRFQGMRGARAFSPLARMSRQLEQATLGAIVVLYRQQKPLVLYPSGEGHQLLSALVDGTNADVQIPEGFTQQERAVWDRLVSDFQSNDEFAARATEDIQRLEEAALAGEQVSTANRLVAQISYPLTIFAMLLVVLAFGHLLSHRPMHDPESEDGEQKQKFIVKSLVIIALFSSLDLVWTLTATHAGTMRELNPLGSRFIDDPLLLATFKLIVTGLSIGILYSLHRRPAAQVASWWCCLLLTLLTARWVIFQSMFA